jgi:hypothetical protein
VNVYRIRFAQRVSPTTKGVTSGDTRTTSIGEGDEAADYAADGLGASASRAEMWVRNAGWSDPDLEETLREDFGIGDEASVQKLKVLAERVRSEARG